MKGRACDDEEVSRVMRIILVMMLTSGVMREMLILSAKRMVVESVLNEVMVVALRLRIKIIRILLNGDEW
jgi:hypothetical protein